MTRTNDRRHGKDVQIAENDLITARDARGLVEQAWRKFRPVVEHIANEAVRAERERAWWRRLYRWVARKP